MSKDEIVTEYTDQLFLKAVLERILGRESWYRLKDHRTLRTWKKECERLLRHSRASLKGTVVVADDEWFLQVDELFEIGAKRVHAADSFDELLGAVAGFFVQMSYLQIGMIPNNSHARNVRADSRTLKLDLFRTVQYVQSQSQKADAERRKHPKPRA